MIFPPEQVSSCGHMIPPSLIFLAMGDITHIRHFKQSLKSISANVWRVISHGLSYYSYAAVAAMLAPRPIQ